MLSRIIFTCNLEMEKVCTVFKHLEKFTQEKYPKFLKSISIYSGFDSEPALQAITEKEIQQIEEVINEDKDFLKINLKGTNYEKHLEDENFKFKFLIGHKTILLKIPQTLDDYIKQKDKKKTVNRNLNQNEVVEILSKKIINYFTKKKFPATNLRVFSFENLAKNVRSFQIDGNNPENNEQFRAKCSLKCPFCTVYTACYKTLEITRTKPAINNSTCDY